MNDKLFFFLNNFAGKSQWFDNTAIFCAEYLPYVLIAVFLAILIFSKKTYREKIKIFIFTGISIFLSRIIITEAIRYFYHANRPFVDNNVHQLIFHETSGSFPSGHAAFFFALAAAVYFFPKGSPWNFQGLPLFFFIGAVLIGVARVIAGIHWPLDILGGAVVGILSVFGVYLAFKSRLQNNPDSV